MIENQTAHRLGFTMQLLPGKADVYKERHDALWPELHALLKEAGIRDYSIFLDEHSGKLFAFLVFESQEKLDILPKQAVMQRWWQYMSDIMETNPDHSPLTHPLKQVFFMP
jgi:L-rhamnose mutarotase